MFPKSEALHLQHSQKSRQRHALWMAICGIIAGLCVACTGCHALHHHQKTPHLAENPILIPTSDSEFLWNQIVDTVDDYFRIDREQRVQNIGGQLTEGRLETHPSVASTWLEPWRADSTPGYERLHSTLQSIRRRAIIRVVPSQGGFLVEAQVVKELEDLSRPEFASIGGATSLRHDGSIARYEFGGKRDYRPTTLGWIPQGRDHSLEQQILAEIRYRMTEIIGN